MRSFAELPGLVAESLAGYDRVALVYLDAFGWRFLERQAAHPLLARATVERWTSRFPSTTAVQTTTIHTGPGAGDALRARLASLVVLPHPGEAAYWLDPPRFEQRLLGLHGGLGPEEMEIPLLRWVA